MLSQSESLSPSFDNHILSVLFGFLSTMELHTAQTVSHAWLNAATNERKKRIDGISFDSPLSSLTIRDLIIDKTLLHLAQERIAFLLEELSEKERKAKEASEKYEQALKKYEQTLEKSLQEFSKSDLSKDQFVKNFENAFKLLKEAFKSLKSSLKSDLNITTSNINFFLRIPDEGLNGHAQELKAIQAILFQRSVDYTELYNSSMIHHVDLLMHHLFSFIDEWSNKELSEMRNAQFQYLASFSKLHLNQDQLFENIQNAFNFLKQTCEKLQLCQNDNSFAEHAEVLTTIKATAQGENAQPYDLIAKYVTWFIKNQKTLF